MGDLDIFFNPLDFGEVREFVISDGTGGTKTLDLTVVWDTDVLKQRGAIVQAQGVFFGDVCVYLRASDLPRIPLAGELIYSPSGTQYTILECDNTLGVVELSLQRVVSHSY